MVDQFFQASQNWQPKVRVQIQEHPGGYFPPLFFHSFNDIKALLEMTRW